jgi:hypothetical protein
VPAASQFSAAFCLVRSPRHAGEQQTWVRRAVGGISWPHTMHAVLGSGTGMAGPGSLASSGSPCPGAGQAACGHAMRQHPLAVLQPIEHRQLAGISLK